MTYLLFILGFIFLIKGAGFLVDGSSSLAKKFNIPDIVIGLTIVAFGTSAPELIVNIIASLKGASDIAIGNVLGSNIANILLILGVSSILYPLSVKIATVWKEIPFSFFGVVLLFLLVNDSMLEGYPNSVLGRVDGLVLISFFVIFLYYVFNVARKGELPIEEVKTKPYSGIKSFFLIILGLVGLTLGGKWIVDGAIDIAVFLGVSQSLIGLTIVAVGTSLPELATSAVAAYKKRSDIAVGNIVGSNIFNILWILGLSSIIHPIPFSPSNNSDILITMMATILLFVVMFIGKKKVLEKWQGAIFILTYIAYIAFLIVKG